MNLLAVENIANSYGVKERRTKIVNFTGEEKMEDKNIEMMKKLIEAKKQKSSEQGWVAQYDKKMGKRRTAGRKIKKGGLFDK